MNDPSTPEPTPDDPFRNRRRALWVWVPAVLAIILIRMYLVADDGIVPLVYDSACYAQTSAHYVAPSHYSIMPLHRPGMSLVAWAAGQVGIPYKLFLDGFLVVAALAAGLLLSRLTSSHGVGLASFATIMLHPWFMFHSQMFMTEPLVAVLMLIIFISLVPVICRPIEQWPVKASVAASLAAIVYVLSRNELILLLALTGMTGCVVLLRRRKSFGREFLSRQGSWRLVLIVVPLVSAWTATQAISYVNHVRFGVKAVCATESPGFKALMDALYSIPTEERNRLAPVTRSSMELACDECPTLGIHRDALLDLNKGAYQIMSEKFDVAGEFGTWLNWHLVDCFGGLHRHSDQQMMVAAREIRHAQNEGRLPYRWGKFPVNPMWRELLPGLPGKFMLSMSQSLFRQHLDLEDHFKRLHLRNSVEKGFFDDGLLRRRGVGFNRSLRIYGQLSDALGTRAGFAQITTPDGEVLITVPVVSGPSGETWFGLNLEDTENPLVAGPLMVRLIEKGDNALVSSAAAVKPMARNDWVSLKFPGANRHESWQLSNYRLLGQDPTRKEWQDRLANWRWIFLVTLSVLALVAGFGRAGDRQQVNHAAWIAVVAIGFVVVRSLFYCLIDLWLGWGLGRYIEPNLYVSIFALVVSGFVFGACIGRLVQRKHGNGDDLESQQESDSTASSRPSPVDASGSS